MSYQYQGYEDTSPFEAGPSVARGQPFYADIFTSRENARDQLRRETLPVNLQSSLEEIDYTSEFLAVLASTRELTSPDTIRGDVVEVSVDSDCVRFEVDIEGWPPLADFGNGRQFYVDFQVFPTAGDAIPESPVVEIPGDLR